MLHLEKFPKHAVLEVNRSLALRTGDMIADEPVNKSLGGVIANSIDNGVLFALQKDGKFKLATDGDEKLPIFIHYTEELITVDFLDELKYFTVEYEKDGNAYPRLIRLHEGDTYTIDTYNRGTVAEDLHDVAYAVADKGGFKLLKSSEAPVKGIVFRAKKSTSPAGLPAVEVMFTGNVLGA